MKLLKKMPFFTQLFLIGAIPLALLGILIGAMLYSRAESTVKEAEKAVISDTINRIDTTASVKAKQIDSFVQSIASSSQMRRAVNEWSNTGKVSLSIANEMGTLFKTTLGSYSEVHSMHFFIGQDDVLACGKAYKFKQDVISEVYSNTRLLSGRVNWSPIKVAVGANDSSTVIEVYEGIADKDGDTIGACKLVSS